LYPSEPEIGEEAISRREGKIMKVRRGNEKFCEMKVLKNHRRNKNGKDR